MIMESSSSKGFNFRFISYFVKLSAPSVYLFHSDNSSVMLKTAGEAGEAGDVKTGWVRLSTSAPLRLITSGEAGERRPG